MTSDRGIALLSGRERRVTGEPCWARGDAVATVGFELEQGRALLRALEQADAEGRCERCF